MVEAIRKDPFVTAEFKLLRPEALFSSTQEEEADKVIADCIVIRSRVIVLMVR